GESDADCDSPQDRWHYRLRRRKAQEDVPPQHPRAIVQVARPQPRPNSRMKPPIVSVIILAATRLAIFRDIFAVHGPRHRAFVEGHSRDNTYAAVETAIAAHPERCCQLLRQSSAGKGDTRAPRFCRG